MEKQSRISYVVFAFTLVIVGINLVSLFFPALLVSQMTEFESTIDPFEPGAWALPVLVTNIILSYFVIMYYLKKLPNRIHNAIQFILNFEVSRRVVNIAIVIILVGYIAFTAHELSIDEKEEWEDFVRIELVLKNFPFGEEGKQQLKILYVKNFLLYSSQEIFQNVKVIPFIGSISLLLLTYFFTAKIANKRFAGIVAMIILLQSYTFLRYDTAATYSNFWTLFYLLSLYLIYNKGYLSPVSYVFSIFSKPLVVIFLPMTLFFTYTANISRRRKIYIMMFYGIIAAVMIAGLSFTEFYRSGAVEEFDAFNFWTGLTTWAFMLRFDSLILLFLLPLTVGLFMISRKGIREADSILILLGGILISAPILAAFTDFNIQPYRFIPLIVFFAVGVGMLLSKKIIPQVYRL